MKIEKVKNYNQKLLAILGTLAVTFLIIGLVTFVSTEFRGYFSNNYEDQTGILSDEKIAELQKENKREQVISYDTPKLIDTANSVYIIPVSHKTLNEKESIIGLLDIAYSSGELDRNPDTRYSNEFYGEFNNVIIYNSKNGSNKKLFDQRVNFNDIRTEYFENEILLLIQASDADTYKDGVINLNDFKSLYIYSFRQNQMKKVSIQGMDVFNYTLINNGNDLVVEFGIDKNDDGYYEQFNEPILIKKFNFESGLMTNIIDDEINSDLQKLLEGTKK